MSEEQLLVTLGVKDKGAKGQITALNRELKYLDKEFKITSKSSDDFGKSQDGLKSKLSNLEKKFEAQKAKLQVYKGQLDKAKESIERKKVELEKLKNSEEDNSKAIEKAEKQLNKYKEEMINATRNINLTEKEMSNLTNEINNTKRSIAEFKINEFKANMEELSNKLEDTSQKFKNFGNGAKNIGGNLMKASAPMIAFAGYATKVSMDFETAMSNVEAISGATGKDLKKLEEKAKEMGRSTSKSAKDAADGMSYMALAGWDTTQMLEGIEPVLRLAEAGNLDLGRASDLTTDSISALGLQVSDLNRYLDICTQAQRKSNTTADSMMEAYIGCGGTLKNLKTPLEESATYIGVLANRGKKGSEAGVALNSVLVNLTSGAGQAGKAMGALGLSAFDSEGNFKGINNTLKELNFKLKDCTEEQRNTYLAMIGGKTQLDTLNALLSGTNEEYDTLYESIKNSDGALNEMSKTMQNNARGNITKLKSNLEGLGIQIGEKILPHINNLVSKLSELVDWFGSLDSETQQSILKFGLFTFASGGVLKAVGSVSNGLGTLIGVSGKVAGRLSKLGNNTERLAKISNLASKGGIYKLGASLLSLNPVTVAVGAGIAAVAGAVLVANTNSKLLSKNILYTKEDMSAFERVISKFNGTSVKSKDELLKMGLVYKDFSKNISPEFQEKVKENTNKINEFAIKLREMNFDGVITDEEINSFTNDINRACDSAIEAIRKKQDESNNAMKDLFVSDGVITESEQKVMDFLNKNSETQINEVNKLRDEIFEIERNALENKQTLNDEEIRQIQEKRARIAQIELEATGKSHEEVLYAQNEFQERIKNIDLEGAKEILTEKAKLRDEEASKINAGYNTQIQIMKEGLEKATDEEKLALEEQIKIAEETRDKKLKTNEDLYNSYLETINERNPEVLANINKFNGEILTQEDLKSQKMLEKLKDQYDGLNSITETGNYMMLDKTSSSLVKLSVVVDEKTGEITGIYDSFSGNVGAYTNEISENVLKVGKEYQSSTGTIKDALNDMSNSTINAKGEIVNANGQVVLSLNDVKNHADGTREGVLNLNGEPINIKANTSGAINNLDEVDSKIRNIPGYKKVTIATFFESVGNGIKNFFNGSHANGLDYVPFDGYIAELHKGERVLTAREAKQYNVMFSGGYFNSGSLESRDLVKSTVNNYNNYNNNSNYNNNVNMEQFTKAITNSLTQALQGISFNVNIPIDNKSLVKNVSKELALGCRRL